MSDWFVVNIVDAPALRHEVGGLAVTFEPRGERFPHFGINVRVLEPGQPASVYHAESTQEAFLVLSGECLAVIDGEERTLRAWDFVHCPAGTPHVFVGAGARAVRDPHGRRARPRPDDQLPGQRRSPRATVPRSRRTPTRPPRPMPSGARTSRPPSSTGRRAEAAGMAGYTVVNLKTVEDQAPKFGFAPHLQSRFARRPLGLERSGISHFTIAPDFRVPFGHHHAEEEEVYVVVAGSARMKLDDEEVELGTWDAIRVAPTVTRGMQGGPEGAEILAFGAPSRRQRGRGGRPRVLAAVS